MPAQAIATKLANGLLPREKPLNLWAGYSAGCRCDGCSKAIAKGESEHEFEFPGGRAVVFHVACSAIWSRLVGDPGSVVAPTTTRPKRVSPEATRQEPWVCPVCVQPIGPQDRVTGTRDLLLHEKCDYAKPRKPV